MRVWTIHKDDDTSSGLQGFFYFGLWILTTDVVVLDFGVLYLQKQNKIIYQLVRGYLVFCLII